MSKLILDDFMNHSNYFSDNHWDLGIADWNYGIGEDGRKKRNTHVKQKNRKNLPVSQVADRDIIWDNEQPNQVNFDELFRVTKYQIIWGCNYIKFNQKDSSSGRIFWDKVNTLNTFSDGEIAWTNLFKGIRQIEFMWNGMMQGKSLKDGRTQQGNKSLNEKKYQGGQKPIPLFQWLLQLKQIKKGWKILDPGAGSGSLCIACEIEGFEYTAFEREKEHWQNAFFRRLEYKQKYQGFEKRNIRHHQLAMF